ncbi:MAG TPA: sialidase family protein, partial [Gaiellaceae bacterium]|nr:sialidase family protein [Gaiellaceae bacterium]
YDQTKRMWLIATLALEGPTTRLTVSRSPDGATWSRPVVAAEATAANGIAFDKEWVVCDNGAASPFRGRCYLVYTDALRNDSLGVVSSTDGGLSWSRPVEIPVAKAVGAFPAIRPNGALVIPFLWRGNRIGSSLSEDGGVTFEAPTLVADIRVQRARGLRFFPLPAADVDPSGRVWVTWHDCRFSAGCNANSVVVSRSTDGQTWTAPVAATSGRNAMLPAIGIHPTTGRVALAYHVVRDGGGVDVELVESRAAGAGWGPPRRLSAETMRPEWMPNTRSGRMLADYISVHYAGARPLVVWILASEPVGASFRQAVYATRG